MKQYKLVPFEIEHLELMGNKKKYELDHAKMDETVTLFVDQHPIMIGGIYKWFEGVGHLWSIMTPAIRKNKILVCKITKEYIAKKVNEYHRIQCYVDNADVTAVRFAYYLGFDAEGLMRKFEGKKDMIIFSKVN